MNRTSVEGGMAMMILAVWMPLGAWAQVPPSKYEKESPVLENVQDTLSTAKTAAGAVQQMGKGTEGVSGAANGLGMAAGVATSAAGAGVSAVQAVSSAAGCAQNPDLQGCADAVRHGGDALLQSVDSVADGLKESGSTLAGPLGKVGAGAGVLSESAQAAQSADKARQYERQGDMPMMYAETIESGYHAVNAAANAAAESPNPYVNAAGRAWLGSVAAGEGLNWASKQVTGQTVLENADGGWQQLKLSGYLGLQDADSTQKYREQVAGTDEWKAKLDRDANDLWYQRYQAPRDEAARRQAFESMRSSNEFAAQLEAQQRAAAEAAAQQSLAAPPDGGFDMFMSQLLVPSLQHAATPYPASQWNFRAGAPLTKSNQNSSSVPNTWVCNWENCNCRCAR